MDNTHIFHQQQQRKPKKMGGTRAHVHARPVQGIVPAGIKFTTPAPALSIPDIQVVPMKTVL